MNAFHRTLVASFVASLGSFSAAQQSSVAPAPGFSPVAIDFRVTSSAGEPIANLSPSEIRLKVAGRERRVESLEFITHAPTADETPSTARASPLPPPFAISSAAGSRAVRYFMLVVDEASVRLGREQSLRDFVSSLLASISPHDHVGLLSLGARGAQVAFTSRHDTIQAAVNAIVGGQPPIGDCHRRVVSQTLQSAVGSIPPGLSSTLFLISGPVLGAQLPAAIGTAQPRFAQACRLLPAEVAGVERAIARSQAQVYVQGLTDLAQAIGVDVALLGGGDRTGLGRILRETESYYRASFRPQNERPDEMHRLELRVDRPNVRVRAPSHVAIPLTSATGIDDARRSASLEGLLLRAAAIPALHSPEKVKLVTVFEPVDQGATIKEAIVVVFDEQGQTVAQATLRPADLDRRPVVSAVTVAPGAYRFRVSAADSSGRRATVEDGVRAELTTAGPISTSGLLFGTIANGTFAPRLEFSREPRATVYLELYGGGPGDLVTVVFELAERVDGPATVSIPGVVRSEATGPRVGTADIPLDSLASGDVLVRAIVSVNGAPAGRVLRTLRKTAPPGQTPFPWSGMARRIDLRGSS